MEEAGERWSKPHVATLQLHVLHELHELLRSDQTLLILNLDDVNDIEQIAGAPHAPALREARASELLAARARPLMELWKACDCDL